jgi:hypothetical protein
MPSNEIVRSSAEISRQEVTPMEMIRAIAENPNIPIDRITALIALQERMEAREAEKSYNRDFAAAMMEMPRVAKRGKKDMKEKGCIAYEKYEDLDAAIRPIETRYGFARSFSTRISDKGAGVILILTLTHRGGHSSTSERYCPPDPGPGRNDTQAIGSGESYGRRYLSKSRWNIVTVGADDDANSADPISEEQSLKLREMLDYLAMTPKQMEGFWKWAAAPENRAEAIQRKDFERIHAELARRVKAQEAQRGGR